MNDVGRDGLAAFRVQARDWLATHFVASLRGKHGWTLHEAPPEPQADVEAWTRAMGETGWGAPTWPKAYGGGGLSADEARVLQEEMDRVGAWNPIAGLGKDLFGPTLLEFGDEAQKRRWLPPMARQEESWCQGFSEPGSGSDLASLQTRAEDRGDHFLVNGQKVWTSGAQWADLCFCLVRTDTSKKHEGISFVVIDMRDPGVEVRPIPLIAGESPFCETFLTDVKVPKANLIGPLNGGWTVAKRLLQYERAGDTSGVLGGGVFGVPGSPAAFALERIGLDGQGRIGDRDLRVRIARHEMDQRIFHLTMRRMMAESRSNRGPSAATSILKNAGTAIGQERSELIVEIMGHHGLGWDGEGFSPEDLARVRGWLAGRATTIFGGSFEVQNNIIAKRILGLPDGA